MPRPREFDHDGVLDCALELFWRQGYEATSIQDLVQCMGIHRGSLYDTFGDKHQLFLATLERYHARVHEEVVRPLRESDDPEAAIRAIFETILADRGEDRCGRGCLLTNAACELSFRNPDVASRIREGLEEIESALDEALGRARGEPSGKTRVEARVLLTTMQGLRVQIRAGRDPDLLRESVGMVLSSFLGPGAGS